MKIIKVYRSICILLIIYLSGIILQSLNSFDTILHISLDSRNEYMSGTNGRKLAQRNPSREALKRPYNCALTEDELHRLYHIIHVESMTAGDILTAIILHLDEETDHVNVEELIRNKLLRRLRMEMPNFPLKIRVTMQARLTQFVEEVMEMSPLRQDIILQKLEAYNVELDQSVEALRYVAGQDTEEEMYEFINDLSFLRESLEVLLRSNGIVVSDDTLTTMVLRIRRRILDILKHHHGLIEENTINRIKSDKGISEFLGSYRLLAESEVNFDNLFDLYRRNFLNKMGYTDEDAERIRTTVESHLDQAKSIDIDRRRNEKSVVFEHIIKRDSNNSISKFFNNFRVLSSPYFLAVCSFILFSNGYYRLFLALVGILIFKFVNFFWDLKYICGGMAHNV
ncbi:Uncharacterized protein PCOAH_00051170 [Plasmodium coatneyi]|uniref:Uncharacterized protein n=1 Tax=Plasmodium coatneyi TaxID=208452 RepID=A0A1B1E6Z4_9APIC|nr:Uncharacterized protein PCOAH_00051170 [Plasmodium coatneyi]ANQ10768.1 Uncharacterized protein PCOAH_00051170 [Plasmodium coatneyi]